jgi:hypothetical protein
VRHGALQSFVAVVRAVPLETRLATFLPLFDELCVDESRWVRNAAFEVLGALVYTLGRCNQFLRLSIINLLFDQILFLFVPVFVVPYRTKH